MNSAVSIRRARDDDGPGLIALIRSVFDEYPGCVLDVEREAPELLEVSSWFARSGGELWIAEDPEGVLVGSCGQTPASDSDGIELRKLYVARSRRHTGLGSALCSRVESAALRSGASFIDLWTDTRFEDAHRFYERRGYVRGRETRELRDLSATVEYYYRKNLDAADSAA